MAKEPTDNSDQDTNAGDEKNGEEKKPNIQTSKRRDPDKAREFWTKEEIGKARPIRMPEKLPDSEEE